MLTLLLMMTLTFVSGSAMAAAMCSHATADAHAAALDHDDAQVAADARFEDSAAKKGMLADAGAFSLPAFILPASLDAPASAAGEALRPPPRDAPKAAPFSIPPPLKPPAR